MDTRRGKLSLRYTLHDHAIEFWSGDVKPTTIDIQRVAARLADVVATHAIGIPFGIVTGGRIGYLQSDPGDETDAS